MRRALTVFFDFLLWFTGIFALQTPFSAVLAETSVNSQEQFRRLKPNGLPNQLNYNFDRAFLEVAADEQDCPAASRAFFNVHINERGEVTKASGRTLSLTARLEGVALKWAAELLKEMRFHPLKYGDKASSVEMPVTLVCESTYTSRRSQ
ncbi:MAG: hypothetical protein ABI833_10030 [Acidobacteriota bacterium]